MHLNIWKTFNTIFNIPNVQDSPLDLQSSIPPMAVRLAFSQLQLDSTEVSLSSDSLKLDSPADTLSSDRLTLDSLVDLHSRDQLNKDRLITCLCQVYTRIP